MKYSNEVPKHLVIPAAVVVGLAMAPRPVDSHYAVPLFELAGVVWGLGLLDVGRILLAAAFLRFGLTPWLLLFAVLEVFTLWTGRYSATGAFFPQTMINGLFLLSLLSLERDQIRSYATKAFSLIFILAAFQKINASYLSGAEFLSTQGFASVSIYFWGHLPQSVSTVVLPWLSIALELGLGVGILWRPTMFANLATLFILVLALVHHQVLYVYFTAFFFLTLIDAQFFSTSKSGRVVATLATPFFWAIASGLVVLVRAVPGQVELAAFLRSWPVIILLIISHSVFAVRNFKLKNDGSTWWGAEDFDLRRQSLPKLALFSLIGLFFAFKAGLVPTPLGFSMFSGSDPSRSPYKVEFKDPEMCEKISRRMTVFGYLDVSFLRSERGCTLAGPTISGRRAAIHGICADFPNIGFQIYESKVFMAPGGRSGELSCGDL